MQHLVLASTSPRRHELLEKLGISFTPVAPEYEESFDDRPPRIQTMYLAQQKVNSVLQHSPQHEHDFVLGADTCIDLDGRILGKPNSRSEARRFLQHMAGRTHRVITALSLWNGTTKKFINETETTLIHVAQLSAAEIEWYLATGEWEGAAGGYRIQGRGSLFVEQIEGCFFNVMGLPIRRFYGMLQSQGVDVLDIVPL